MNSRIDHGRDCQFPPRAATRHDDRGRCGPRRCATPCSCCRARYSSSSRSPPTARYASTAGTSPSMMRCRTTTLRNSWCSWAYSACIAGALLVLNVAQRWLGETLKLRLRQGLVRDLIRNWLQPGRAFRLANAGADGRQSGPAHARGCAPSHRAVGRSWDRPAAVLDPARHLRESAVVAVDQFRLSHCGPAIRNPGLHGVGRDALFGLSLAAELLGRAHV